MLYKSMFTLLTYFTDCTIREKTNQLLTYVLVTQTDTDRDIQRDRQTNKKTHGVIVPDFLPLVARRRRWHLGPSVNTSSS